MKKQEGGFLGLLLGTLGASLFGNLLTGKGIVRAGSGNKKWKRNRKGWLRKRMGFLILPHPSTNFEIQNCYRNESRFNGVYSRNNLPEKIKDGEYAIKLDELRFIAYSLDCFIL